MGSFDDAIRQHLDLKRRRGASLREVASMEREALGDELLGQPGPERRPTPFDGDALVAEDALADRSRHHIEARRKHLSQETIEIDMAQFIEARRIEPQERHAYDWNAETRVPDIADPSSDFDWETPARDRLHGRRLTA